MIKLYHNPRCSKSREGLKYLEEKSVEFETIKYLDDIFDFDTLKAVIKKLNIKPIELVRLKEKDWKENFKSKDLSDDEIIRAMVDYPRLIERPIVVNGEKAVIARPVGNIDDIL